MYAELFSRRMVLKKMQTRKRSLIESIANIVIGYSVGIGTASSMGVVFSVISFVRSYALRRGFNLLHRLGWLR